jgi:glycosyltransferase involved in cell wall biosynthesis
LKKDIGASIVIPTYNRSLSLGRLLDSLEDCRDIEIIVVDDGSSDNTKQIVEQRGNSNLIYLKQRNQGPAAARNRGIRAATSKIIVFTDDDCLATNNWPWPLVDKLKSVGKEYAGIGGKVEPLVEGLISKYMTFHRILEPPESLSYLVTSNCAYWKSCIEEAGGFNESIGFPGGEDPELSFKLREKGYMLGYEPKGVVKHDYRESITDFLNTFYRYGKGCGYVLG